MAEIELNEENFDKEVIKSSQPVMVDFWAPWCGPCRMMSPVVEELATKYSGKAKIGKLNTDDNPNIASEYQISAIPTLLFFKDGKVVKEIVGVQPKEEISKILDSLI
jgi:thioredoxin 1